MQNVKGLSLGFGCLENQAICACQLLRNLWQASLNKIKDWAHNHFILIAGNKVAHRVEPHVIVLLAVVGFECNPRHFSSPLSPPFLFIFTFSTEKKPKRASKIIVLIVKSPSVELNALSKGYKKYLLNLYSSLCDCNPDTVTWHTASYLFNHLGMKDDSICFLISLKHYLNV